MAFTVIRHPAAAAFLEAAEGWLLGEEVENDLLLGLARALASAALPPPREPPYLATLLDGAAVVGCALRTPPHKLVLTRFDAAAADTLAATVHAAYPALDAVVGPEPSVDVFAAAWARHTGRVPRCTRREQLYVLRHLDPASDLAPGSLRSVAAADTPLLLDWIAGFHRDIGETHFAPADYLAPRRESLRIWDDGGPVSLAGWSGETPHGARVNLVYTPLQHRGRGYARACVTALSGALLGAGRRYCCLYADLANPVSNHVYRRIGYRPLCPVGEWLLG